MSARTKAPKSTPSGRPAPIGASALAQALLQRVDQRTAASGTLRLPAVPALLDFYVDLCGEVFATIGRAFAESERVQARHVIDAALQEAFSRSPRSKLVLRFEARPGCTLGYEVHAEVSSIADAYARWIGTSEEPLFGAHADARVWNLAEEMSHPAQSPVLDLGAGTGRNALALARRGHPVDAVEITPKFAEMISATAAQENLPIRVIVNDVLNDCSQLRCDYRMLFASEVVSDFRGLEDLRRLFVLADRILTEGGLLVFNLHVAAPGYTPDRAAREFAQQCYSALYTARDVAAAAKDLPFTLQSNDSAHDYELTHLPAEAWPPTPWFVNWSLGLDVFETERACSPVELRWLVFRKASAHGEPLLQIGQAGIAATGARRARRFDTAELRRALLQRLKRRWQASGSFTFPAVPNLRDHYLNKSLRLFEVLGRHHGKEQRHQANEIFDRVLVEAYAQSQRSNIEVNYQAPMGTELRYAVTADAVPLADMYDDWFERLPPPLFGDYPDARLIALLEQEGVGNGRVLDLGAGTGRNALHLARLGYSVDAVELAPKLAAAIRRAAAVEPLPLRVYDGDLFDQLASNGTPYSMILMGGVGADFRDISQLQRFFALTAERLKMGGYLIVSLHIAAHHYVPDAAARQWAQQCCAMFFTRGELEGCSKGLGLRLVSDDSAFEFESTHLPVQGWPPTPVYIEWATCQHVFALPREDCPVELRWLVYRKLEINED